MWPVPVFPLFSLYGPGWRTPQHYDAVLRGQALVPGSELVSLCYGYDRLVSLLLRGNWKKTMAYCDQMALVTDDPLIGAARAAAERRIAADAASPAATHAG